MAQSNAAVTASAPAGPNYAGAPLSGLSGLYGNESADPNQTFDQGVLEAHGFEVHKGHGSYGALDPGALPYSGTGYGAQVNQGFSPDFQLPGNSGLNRTPTAHNSPYPRGILQQSWDAPDALADAGQQIRALHARDLGGPRQYSGDDPAGHEEISHYTTNRYTAPNTTVLGRVPGQVGGTGSAGKDTSQGYGQLNPSNPEFQAGHSIRRVQHDSVPFDMTNTHGPGIRPFLGRVPIAQARFDGPDSPYYAAGNINGGQIMARTGGATPPTAYQAPPDPDMVQAPVSAYSPFAW